MRGISKLLLGVTLIILALVGCSDSTPSESQMKKQISSLYASCPLISVTNFQKSNGMLQKDGSYVAAIKYTLTLSPTKDNQIAYQAYQPEYEQMMAKKEIGRLNTLYEKYHEKMVADFNKHCKTGFPFADFIGDDIQRFGNEIVGEVSNNFVFIKTDNGWVISLS